MFITFNKTHSIRLNGVDFDLNLERLDQAVIAELVPLLEKKMAHELLEELDRISKTEKDKRPYEFAKELLEYTYITRARELNETLRSLFNEICDPENPKWKSLVHGMERCGINTIEGFKKKRKDFIGFSVNMFDFKDFFKTEVRTAHRMYTASMARIQGVEFKRSFKPSILTKTKEYFEAQYEELKTELKLLQESSGSYMSIMFYSRQEFFESRIEQVTKNIKEVEYYLKNGYDPDGWARSQTQIEVSSHHEESDKTSHTRQNQTNHQNTVFSSAVTFITMPDFKKLD